jgi:hypothetical protein
MFLIYTYKITSPTPHSNTNSKHDTHVTLLSKNIKINIELTIILSVVLLVYGCETLSLTFREKRRLRMFENKVLRRIFGPKRDEVTGEWRRLHNKELYVLLTKYLFG